jgi:hypothetical protein
MDEGVCWTIKFSEAKKLGVHGFIEKPFSSATILESLSYLIEKREMRDIEGSVGSVGTRPARGYLSA